MSVFSLGIRFDEQKALWVDTQGETQWTHTYNRYNTVGRLRYYQTSHSLNVCTLRVSARIRWWEPRWASNAPLQKSRVTCVSGRWSSNRQHVLHHVPRLCSSWHGGQAMCWVIGNSLVRWVSSEIRFKADTSKHTQPASMNHQVLWDDANVSWTWQSQTGFQR